MWGAISQNKINELDLIQKKCVTVRILFGDFNAYIDKFKTCGKTRPFISQILGSYFYKKENTKPLFE